MKATARQQRGLIAAIALPTALLSACTSAQTQQQIQIDGSSTVFPITAAVVKEYQQTATAVPISLKISGTSGGFKKFCAGEIDINNASRPIDSQEMEACRQAGIAYVELPIAFDAITVVIHPQNNWAKNITIAELKLLWQPAAEKKITSWQQARSNWPNKPINLYGPGRNSGTFDYFTEVVNGKAKASRQDYTASEDDDILVKKISQDPNALGYFGLAYYEANSSKLKALAIASNKGFVLPSRQTVERAEYQPLSRPLFIYVSAKAAQSNPQARAFVEFYLQNAQRLASAVGYIPLPEKGYQLAYNHFERGKIGTVFNGQAQPNLTISELLLKEAEF